MIDIKEYKPKASKLTKNVADKKYSIQFLPIQLENISTLKTLNYKGKKIKVSYLIDIIHNLILKYYFKKDNMFNLSSLILKEKYGHNYNYYMDYLIENNHIILFRNYLKGKHTKIYKLPESIIKGDIIRYKNSDKVLLKKYRSAIILIEKENIESNKIPQDVKKKLVDDLFHIKIHFEKAIFFLDAIQQDFDIYNKNKYSVECINDKQIFYHFDSYGRMHTNYTILKSFIRKNCLSIDGFDTIEFDIKNSQPLFLCKLIQNGRILVDKNEFELYKYLTYNGLFYQYIIDNSDYTDRKLVKDAIYKVFFGKNFKSKADTMFFRLFPTIYNLIKTFKKIHNDYKVLAHELQNLESNLIFNKIIKEIMYVAPDVRLITIHDSIICSQEHKEIVEKIFNNNLKKEFQIL
jgi:hypothetical protein